MAFVSRVPLPKGTYTLTSGWRTPVRPSHRGIDLGCNVGTPVYASMDGTLSQGNEPGGAGWWLNLTGSNGEVHKFFHLSDRLVTSGFVKAGTRIASTGGQPGHPGAGSSNGPHLHFETWWLGRDIDPWPLVLVAIQAALQFDTDVLLIPVIPQEEEMSAAEVAEIKAHVTAEAVAVIDSVSSNKKGNNPHSVFRVLQKLDEIEENVPKTVIDNVTGNEGGTQPNSILAVIENQTDIEARQVAMEAKLDAILTKLNDG